jgi:hypothetical protein
MPLMGPHIPSCQAPERTHPAGRTLAAVASPVGPLVRAVPPAVPSQGHAPVERGDESECNQCPPNHLLFLADVADGHLVRVPRAVDHDGRPPRVLIATLILATHGSQLRI